MANKNTLYLEKEKLLFGRARSGFFEPVGYNVENNNGDLSGEEIMKGSFFHDFIMFIRFSERKKVTSGKLRGTLRDGFAETYQWVFAFKALGITRNMNAEQLIGVFSRQS